MGMIFWTLQGYLFSRFIVADYPQHYIANLSTDQVLRDQRRRGFEQHPDELLEPIEEGPVMCEPEEYYKSLHRDSALEPDEDVHDYEELARRQLDTTNALSLPRRALLTEIYSSSILLLILAAHQLIFTLHILSPQNYNSQRHHTQPATRSVIYYKSSPAALPAFQPQPPHSLPPSQEVSGSHSPSLLVPLIGL